MRKDLRNIEVYCAAQRRAQAIHASSRSIGLLHMHRLAAAVSHLGLLRMRKQHTAPCVAHAQAIPAHSRVAREQYESSYFSLRNGMLTWRNSGEPGPHPVQARLRFPTGPARGDGHPGGEPARHGHERHLRSLREALPAAGEEEEGRDEGAPQDPQPGLQRDLHLQGGQRESLQMQKCNKFATKICEASFANVQIRVS